MSEAPLMLGVSGLRGIVGQSLTPEVATNFACAFGTWLREDQGYGLATVVVGRDGRLGSEAIEAAAIEGLVKSGCDVIRTGIATTPSIGVGASDPECEAGLVITASHNPAEWNGLKCIVYDRGGKGGLARAPLASEAIEIISRYQSGAFHQSNDGRRGTITAHSRATCTHVDHVWWLYDSMRQDMDDPKKTNFSVAIDSVNCSGSVVALPFLDRLGALIHPVACDGSGIFPHTPEPTAENLSGEGGLCDAVQGLKADVGFAQDPDGDRLAIVDEKGNYIGEEYTLVLAAMSILEARKSRGREHAGGAEEDGALTPALSRGAREREEEKTPHPGPLTEGEREDDVVICVNLSTSRMIDDVAARYGARVVRTAVGEANVVEAMKKLKKEGKNVILGGEGNGGVIWPEVTYVRDSLGAMALTLSLMARTGKTVSELVADVPSYAIVKRKQPLAKKEDARPTVDRLASHYTKMGEGVRVDTQDGVRIDFDADRAWVHVRASNTEPILRLIGEAPTRERAEAVLDEVQRLVDAG